MSKVPLVVGLQKIIQAFKKWLPFKPGDGESSLAQDGNQAFAVNGTALGYQTIVGSKGYRISAFAPGDKDENGNYINGTYTLVLNQDELISQEIKGATYCIYLKQSKDSVGTISAINGNVITVDGFLYPAKWDEGEWEELDENGNKTGNTLTGDAWEQAKAEAFASSYIIFEGLPTIGNINVGTGAHAEGWGNIATQIGSHAEGAESKALGKYSHAEGNGSVAYYSAHSEGKYAKAIGYHSHAEGYQTESIGMDSHAEGRTTKAIGQDSHAEGISTSSEGIYSHAEGSATAAKGQAAHSEGQGTEASGSRSHAEGFSTNASGQAAHSEGYRTISSNVGSHSEGVDTQATAKASHAEGLNSKATAQSSHAEGYNSTASGENSHAEGYITTASGIDAHTEGRNTVASGQQSHAQGSQSKAYGNYSHAGGLGATTGILNEDGTVVTNSGAYAFSHGYQTSAKARGSVALGRDTTATEDYQTVVGSFNDTSIENARFVVGTGTNANNLKNGLVVYTDGHVSAGKGGASGNDLVTVDQLNNTYFSQTKKVISTSSSIGWYQIAKGSNIKPVSGIFKVTAQIQAGGLWSEIIFVASKAFNADGKVTIINEQAHTNGAAINDVRLRYTNNTANSDVYVDVHCKNNNNSATDTVTISVELIDSTKTDKLAGGLWNLTDIVQEPSTGWTYAKQINAKKILAINSDGTGSIQTPSSPSDDNIANVGFVKEQANTNKSNIAINTNNIAKNTADIVKNTVRIDGINLALGDMNTVTTVEDAYDTRTTANGLPIISGMETKVSKIEGASKQVSIGTVARQIISVKDAWRDEFAFECIDFTFKFTIEAEDAAEGFHEFSVSGWYEWNYEFLENYTENVYVSNVYRISVEYSSTSGLTDHYSISPSDSFRTGRYLASIQISADDTGNVQMNFSLTARKNAHAKISGIKSTNPNVPHTESILSLGTTYELAQGDYIDLDNQKLVKRGKTTNINIPNTYIAYRNGTEEILGNDNAQQQAYPTITQTYYTKTGGTE